MSDLDKDFDSVRKDVHTLMQAAAALIKQAKQIVDDSGMPYSQEEFGGLNSYDFYNEVKPLKEAMDKAGWSTSSWHC
jgi:hypothetical protein